MRQLGLLAIAVILLALAGMNAASAGHAAELTITGEVSYRERIALPQPATLRVHLIDLSRDGLPTTVQAEALVPDQGQIPLSFTLNFLPSVIVDGHAYGITAEIVSGETVFFRNPKPVPVAPLAPVPTDVLVQFLGADGDSGNTTLEVATSPALVDVVWELQSIAGAPAGSPVTLSISSDLRAGGKAPCNSYFASVELGEGEVSFGAVAATRMLCAPGAMAAEQAFFSALDAVRAYALDGDRLTLAGADGKPVLGFRQQAN